MGGLRRRWPLTGSALSGSLARWTQAGCVKSVQSGTVAMTTTTATATITAVDVNNAILFFLGCSQNDGAAATAGDDFVRITLTNGTTVTSTRGTNVNAGIRTSSFLVIEFFPGVVKSLQYGTIALAGAASATATINPVNTLKTLLSSLGYSTTNGGAMTAQMFLRMAVTNSTTITGTLDAGLANTTASFCAAEFF